MNGALSLFPAGSPRCLTVEHLYNPVILKPARYRCPLPRSTCPGSQLPWNRHYSRSERDLELRHLLQILLQQLNHHSGPSVNPLTPNHGLLGRLR